MTRNAPYSPAVSLRKSDSGAGTPAKRSRATDPGAVARMLTPDHDESRVCLENGSKTRIGARARHGGGNHLARRKNRARTVDIPV